jgi:putative nucleic acid binding protein
MSPKKTILIIVVLALAIAGWFGWKEYSRTNRDLEKATPDFVVTASEFIREFEASDSVATKKYNGKIIEVTGNVKTVEKDEKEFYTIVIGDSTNLSAVRCSMDTAHNADAAGLTPGSSVRVRGICTGFNNDDLGLGSDVILVRCAIIKKNN